MRLPIDTTTIKFAAAGAAEPVLDFATKSQKTDEHGVPLFQVPVFAAGGGIKDSITIKFAGDVKGLSEFTLVSLDEVRAAFWPDLNERLNAAFGDEFRAVRGRFTGASTAKTGAFGRFTQHTAGVSRTLQDSPKPLQLQVFRRFHQRAGDGNRTRVLSLNGVCSQRNDSRGLGSRPPD